MKTVWARLGAALAALLMLAGLCAPAATAAPSGPVQAAAVQPAMSKKGWDPWSIACASSVLPFPPAQIAGLAACGKKVADKAAPEVGKKVKDTVVEGLNATIKPFADGVAKFTADMIKTGVSWWLLTDSVQIKDTGVIEDKKDPSSSISLHAIMLGIGTMIAILMAIFQGMRTIIQRKGQPLVQAMQGLILNVLVITVGVGVIDSLLVASDELTKAILKAGFGENDAPERMAAMLLPQIGNPAGILLMALVVFLVGGIQVVLLFLRQAAIPIQAMLLPVAGAGQMGADTARQWLPRLITAILTIICYKPMAALIITIGFIEIDNGSGIVDWLRGVVTLVLSVLAMKALMTLFAPIGMAVGSASASGGIAGGLMGMVSAGGGAMGGAGGSGGSGDSGGTSAADHASYMDRSGPAGGGRGGSAGAPAEGDTAVQHASSNAPNQAAPAAQGAEAGAAASSSGGAAAGAGASSSSAAAGAGTAAGPVSIAVVAAEAGNKAKNTSANTMGGTE